MHLKCTLGVYEDAPGCVFLLRKFYQVIFIDRDTSRLCIYTALSSAALSSNKDCFFPNASYALQVAFGGTDQKSVQSTSVLSEFRSERKPWIGMWGEKSEPIVATPAEAQRAWGRLGRPTKTPSIMLTEFVEKRLILILDESTGDDLQLNVASREVAVAFAQHHVDELPGGSGYRFNSCCKSQNGADPAIDTFSWVRTEIEVERNSALHNFTYELEIQPGFAARFLLSNDISTYFVAPKFHEINAKDAVEIVGSVVTYNSLQVIERRVEGVYFDEWRKERAILDRKIYRYRPKEIAESQRTLEFQIPDLLKPRALEYLATLFLAALLAIGIDHHRIEHLRNNFEPFFGAGSGVDRYISGDAQWFFGVAIGLLLIGIHLFRDEKAWGTPETIAWHRRTFVYGGGILFGLWFTFVFVLEKNFSHSLLDSIWHYNSAGSPVSEPRKNGLALQHSQMLAIIFQIALLLFVTGVVWAFRCEARAFPMLGVLARFRHATPGKVWHRYVCVPTVFVVHFAIVSFCWSFAYLPLCLVLYLLALTPVVVGWLWASSSNRQHSRA